MVEIQERYGQSNAPLLCEIHKKLMSTQQNDNSVSENYAKLKKIWEQPQVLEPYTGCSCGDSEKCKCSIFNKMVEGDHFKKLIYFLTDLNKH